MSTAGGRATRVQLPGAAVAPVALAAGLVQLGVASWMHARGLVTGSPVALAVLMAVVVASGTRAVQTAIGRGRVDSRPVLRLTVAFSLFASLTWTAGWSFVMPATAILVGIVQVQRSGHAIWRTALGIVTAVTVAGQIGVALGWVATVAQPAVSHVAAAGLLVVTAVGLVVVGSAVAERDTVQAELERTEARLRVLMESSQDVLTVSDADGYLTYVSPAASHALGRSPEDLVGTELLGLADVGHRPMVAEALRSVAGVGARTSIDVPAELTTRERRWFEWSVLNLLDDPLVAGLVTVQRDVTDRLRHQEALAYAAGHDDLTDLPNRSDLIERIAAAAEQTAPRQGLAVLFLDLDRFKDVNDRYGHAAGDELLQVIARRLRGALRPQDHLARVSGDEFCALLTGVHDQEGVTLVVERLRAVVGRPVALVDGAAVTVGVAIGQVLTFTARPAEELFTSADAAMYLDKGRRRRDGHADQDHPAQADRREGAPTRMHDDDDATSAPFGRRRPA